MTNNTPMGGDVLFEAEEYVPTRRRLTPAVQSTIDHLDSAGLIGPEHEALVALVLTTAEDIDNERKLTVSKATMRNLIADLLERLPAPPEQTSSVWDELQAEMAALDAR